MLCAIFYLIFYSSRIDILFYCIVFCCMFLFYISILALDLWLFVIKNNNSLLNKIIEQINSLAFNIKKILVLSREELFLLFR